MPRHRRQHAIGAALLTNWPIEIPADRLDFVKEPRTDDELTAPRQSAIRGSPFGEDAWTQHIARQLQLEPTLRPRRSPPEVEITE